MKLPEMIELMDPVERLLAEHQCQRLLVEFIRRLDLGDPSSVAELFTPDGIWESPGGSQLIRGREELRTYFGSRPADRMSRRLCTNVLIDIESPTRATGTSYPLHQSGGSSAGTMVFLRTTGWERQDFPKTVAGQRTIHLPPFALAMLRRRRSEEPHRRDSPLFASRSGTFVQPDNMRRSLRCALQRQADLKWVSPHVFRKKEHGRAGCVTDGKQPHGTQE